MVSKFDLTQFTDTNILFPLVFGLDQLCSEALKRNDSQYFLVIINFIRK